MALVAAVARAATISTTTGSPPTTTATSTSSTAVSTTSTTTVLTCLPDEVEIRCRLDLLAITLEGTADTELGGRRRAHRLARKITRARELVIVAKVRRFRNAAHQVRRFIVLLDQGVARGSIHPDLSDDLRSRATAVASMLDRLVS